MIMKKYEAIKWGIGASVCVDKNHGDDLKASDVDWAIADLHMLSTKLAEEEAKPVLSKAQKAAIAVAKKYNANPYVLKDNILHFVDNDGVVLEDTCVYNRGVELQFSHIRWYCEYEANVRFITYADLDGDLEVAILYPEG